jgi:hypothetical protein
MFSSSFSNGFYFIPYSSDEDLNLEDMDQNDLIIFQMTVLAISNSNEQVISYEMEERGSFMDPRCFGCIGYYVHHTNIIQEFDIHYIGGI